ncbi:flagellar export chaperone FlgN, partial [Pseudomonas syringae]
MQDTTLLQMITDDMVSARQLLELLQAESLILHGRDMSEMEQVLAQKQALVILLDQHGRKRSQVLAGMGLPA